MAPAFASTSTQSEERGSAVMAGARALKVCLMTSVSCGAGFASQSRATARQRRSREVPPKGLEEWPPWPRAVRRTLA